MNKSFSCPLCTSSEVESFAQDSRRCYFECQRCHLVFVDQHDFLCAKQEKQVYDQHQNNPQDSGYRQFLSRLFEPVLAQLTDHACGLDFGSGPGPTLSLMFEEAGHSMRIFDPFYANDPLVWQQQYDFITASEVVEHVHQLGVELERLWHHLNRGGVLGVMTKMVTDVDAFGRWHYKNDPTHVRFFSRQTCRWLAQHWQAECEFFGADVVIFRKSVDPYGVG